MDPFSITVGVFGLLQTVTACLKLFKKHVGPSSMSLPEAESLKKSLYEFLGVMKSFQTYLELEADEDERMEILDYLVPAVVRCREALRIIEEYLKGGRTEKLFRGVRFDKRLKLSQKSLDDARQLFMMAVSADHQKTMASVNSYVKSLSEDLKDVRSSQHDAQQDHSFESVRKWLNVQTESDTNSQIHERNLVNRDHGSCKWLLDHSAFQEWSNTKKKGIPSKLWLRGSLGSGKSFICSAAIESVVSKPQDICLYYFYRFDDQYAAGAGGGETQSGAVTVAALLVQELFRYFWRRDRRVADSISAYTKTMDKTMTSLAEVIRLIFKHIDQHSPENVIMSDLEPIRLFLFLDGLDENKDPRAASKILELFNGLEEKFPVILKIWISSREGKTLNQDLKEWVAIRSDNHVEDDIRSYLMKAVRKFRDDVVTGKEVEDKPLDDWIQEKLQTRAKGNFLYAKLMVDWLQNDGLSIDDIMILITSKVPDKIDEMYKRIFLQYQKEQHKYISLIFSLIAFACRPLRLSELQEAITLSLSDSAIGLDPSKAPRRIQQMFAPLIERQDDPNEPGNPFYRLYHSTVLEFLIANPDVLHVDASVRGPFLHTISPSRTGELCLRYLSQVKYSRLTELHPGSCHVPLTLSSGEIQQHGLLPYCAKFWVKHLDDLEPTAELRKKLTYFLKSPNFQTLLQAQSLFVAAQFSQFKLTVGIGSSRPMYRRAFPRWFEVDLDSGDPKSRKEARNYFLDYRHFISEWGYLLERGSCNSYEQGDCPFEHFWGEVDRCLNGLLGPTHFMKNMEERYQSFMLNTEPFEYHESTQLVIGEAISASNFQYIAISSASRDSNEISLDIWDLSLSDAPRLILNRTLPVDPNCQSDTSRTITFSSEANTFLLGDLALDKQDFDSPILLGGTKADGTFQPLSTDFDKRGRIIVIANRNVAQRARENKPPGQNIPGQGHIAEDWDTDDTEDESQTGSDDSCYSTSTDENSAYETHSEGSTEYEFSESEDDISEDFSVDEDSLADFSDDDQDEKESDLGSDDGKQKVKKEPERAMLVVNQGLSSETKFEFEGDRFEERKKRPTYPGVPGRFKDPSDRITANVTVYDTGSGQAVRLFHYKHEIPSMLYHSPPVLHPQKALLVWPLGGGEVLFADYDEKRYFTRTMMPTTAPRDTRHICMKAHFSPCGEYLHISSVEGRIERTRPAATSDLNEDREHKQRIALSLFLTTHRLSSRKTSTSPPRLIHKARLVLGHFVGLSLAKLPFTFTWTPEHLHFTVSGTRLNIFRIRLFRPSTSTTADITVPRLSVMLPLSASAREVHYLPPARESDATIAGRGVVLLGSYGVREKRVQLQHSSEKPDRSGMGDVFHKELQDYASPAVGLFVDEERDLGGWIPFNEERGQEEEMEVTKIGDVGERLGDGKLTRRMEAFSWQEDVDLEGICDQCNSPMRFWQA